MNDRRSKEPVPRDPPDQQAGGPGEDDHWDAEVPDAPDLSDDGHRDDATVPEEPAD